MYLFQMVLQRLHNTAHQILMYRVFWDTGYWPIFLRDTGIFGGGGLFWDMGYSGILGYGMLEFILGCE